MRLLYVCSDRGIPVLGGKGASVHVRSVTSALTRRGHEVSLVCAALGSGNAAPDVVSMVQLSGAETSDATTLLQHIRDYQIEAVIERYSLSSGSAASAARAAGIAHVLEVNAPLVLEAARYRGLTHQEMWLRRERGLFESTDAIGVVSRALERYVARVAPQTPTRWIPNGVDASSFRDVTPINLGLAQDAVTIGFIGSMKAWHGVRDLVEAIASLGPASPAHLVLAGHGPELADVVRVVEGLGLTSRTHVLGEVSHEAIPAVIAAFDIGVAPYRPSEDFYFCPLKVLEYLAGGIPVICPALGDLPELTGDGAVLYDPADPTGLANALRMVIEDSDLRADTAQGSLARADRFSWDQNAVQYEALVAEAPGRRRAALLHTNSGWTDL